MTAPGIDLRTTGRPYGPGALAMSPDSTAGLAATGMDDGMRRGRKKGAPLRQKASSILVRYTPGTSGFLIDISPVRSSEV
jgi:hypothetical protein